MPSYDLPGKPDAGAIVIFSNVAERNSTQPRPPTARTLLTADDFGGLSAQANGRFGAAVAVGPDRLDDADFCADLWVGAPGHTVSGLKGAGQVVLLNGRAGGLRLARATDEAGLAEDTDGPQAGAGFGSALALQNNSTLAIGAPGFDVGRAVDAGKVVRIDNLDSEDGGDVSIIKQGEFGGAAESGDRFGEVLALAPTAKAVMLLVGVPHEDVGSVVDAGAVAITARYGQLSFVSQDSPGAAGTAEAGDRYGASIDSYATFVDGAPLEMVVIGVPGEDIGSVNNAGMVSYASVRLPNDPDEDVDVIRGRSTILTQDTPGVPGSVEAGDGFGSAVTTGEFGRVGGGLQKIVATAPAEDLGRRVDAGLLTMTSIDEQTARPAAVPQPGAWTQDSTGVSGAAENGDRFASAVSGVQLTRYVAEDGDGEEDLGWPITLVTVPYENVGSVVDGGLAYLGVAPGAGSVVLLPPVNQTGAGVGMVPMTMAIEL